MSNETTSTTRAELYSIQVEDLIEAASSVGNLESLWQYIPVDDDKKTFRVPVSALVTAQGVNEGSAPANSAHDTGSGGSGTIAHVAMRFAQSYLDYKATGVKGLAQAGVNGVFRAREATGFDFSAVTPTVGAANSAITLAVAHSSIMELEQNGFLNPNKAFILSPEGKQHIQYRITASTGVANGFFGPRFLQGKAEQHVGMFLDMYPVYISNLLTASTSGIASGIFVTHDPRYNAGLCWKALGERGQIEIMPTNYDNGLGVYITQINALYGFSIVDSTAACSILHQATATAT